MKQKNSYNKTDKNNKNSINNNNLNKSIIEKIKNDFNKLFKSENEIKKEKYEKILNKAIASLFLNNEEIKNNIQTTFLLNNDFLIEILKNNEQTPKKGII